MAFNVTSFPTGGAIPTYWIYRDFQTGRPCAAADSLCWYPPEGSDELFDALRTAFPYLNTHAERVRDATIKFLIEEQQQREFQPAPMTPQSPSPTTTARLAAGDTWTSEWNNTTVDADGNYLAIPKCDETQPPDLSSATLQMPAQDAMTGVFSLTTNRPRTHARRRMTEKEKAEYRERRLIRACEDCAKRKRKVGAQHDVSIAVC